MSQKSKKNEERENTLDKSSPMHTVRECSLFYELGMHHSDRELVLAFKLGSIIALKLYMNVRFQKFTAIFSLKLMETKH